MIASICIVFRRCVDDQRALRAFWMLRTALSASILFTAVRAGADVIRFPVDTPVFHDSQLNFWVERPPLMFQRWGALSINTQGSAGLHPGGLSVQPLSQGLDTLWIHADGAAFRLEQLTAVELNTTTGLRLVVAAREHAGGLWFEEELPFDLNMQTYDVFDLLAVNDRFGAVDQVAITIESPNVDPVFGPYILDAVDITLTTPPCVGDLNDDLVVDLADLSTLLGHFGTTGGATLADGDLDGDDDVDLADLARLLTNFGRVCR